MALSDAELVRLCLEGDTDAYGELVARYQGAVYATAFYYVGRYGAVEDIAQDSFLAAYRSLPKLKEPARFGPWLREVTCRTAANWLRKHGRRLQNETPLPYRRTVSIEDARRGPEHILQQDEDFRRVQAAVENLPEQYRLPVVLRYLQELSYDEIARYTGQTRDEIRGCLNRAGHMLREMLSAEDGGDSEEPPQWQPARK